MKTILSILLCFAFFSCTLKPEPVYESLGVKIYSLPSGWTKKEDYHNYAIFGRETESNDHKAYLKLESENPADYPDLNALKDYVDANIFIITDTNRFSIVRRTVDIATKLGCPCIRLDAEVTDNQSDFSNGLPVTILTRKYYLFHPYIRNTVFSTSFYESGLQSEVDDKYLVEAEAIIDSIKLVNKYE